MNEWKSLFPCYQKLPKASLVLHTRELKEYNGKTKTKRSAVRSPWRQSGWSPVGSKPNIESVDHRNQSVWHDRRLHKNYVKKNNGAVKSVRLWHFPIFECSCMTCRNWNVHLFVIDKPEITNEDNDDCVNRRQNMAHHVMMALTCWSVEKKWVRASFLQLASCVIIDA